MKTPTPEHFPKPFRVCYVVCKKLQHTPVKMLQCHVKCWWWNLSVDVYTILWCPSDVETHWTKVTNSQCRSVEHPFGGRLACKGVYRKALSMYTYIYLHLYSNARVGCWTKFLYQCRSLCQSCSWCLAYTYYTFYAVAVPFYGSLFRLTDYPISCRKCSFYLLHNFTHLCNSYW